MRNLLSTLLLVGAVALFAFAAWMWFDERRKEDELPAPPVIVGQAELKNVVDALRAEGIEVDYGQQAVFSEVLNPPGQSLTANGDPLYIFLFENPPDREAQVGTSAGRDLPMISGLGTPVAAEEVHLAQQSNVLAVLVSDDPATIAAVDAAIESIP